MRLLYFMEHFLDAGHKESPGVLEVESSEDQEARQCSMDVLHKFQM